MALALSVKKGQAVLICGLCENDSRVQWKCMDCKLYICQRCKEKVHPKFPSAEDHTMVHVREISHQKDDSGGKTDVSKLKCGTHKEKKCCLYCKTCKDLVCQKCVAKNHKKHTFVEVSDEYEIRLDQLRNRLKYVEMEIQTLKTGKEELHQISQVENSTYDKEKKQILDHEKAVILSVNRHTKQLLTELDQNWKAFSQDVYTQDKKVSKMQQTLVEQANELEDLLLSRDPQKVFAFSESLDEALSMNIDPVQMIYNHIPKYLPGEIKNIDRLCGILSTANKSNECCHIFHVVQEFPTYHSQVSRLLTCPDGSLWMYCKKDDFLQNAIIENGNLKTVSTVKSYVFDMALTLTGDLLISCEDSVIKILSQGSQTIKDSVYNVPPFNSLGVHVNHDQKVIVGAADKNPDYEGPAQVIVMDQKGKQKKMFKYDRDNKPLFKFPVHVTSNKKNNIAVIDCEGDTGRVVVIGHEGTVKNIYNGHTSVNTEDKPFTPWDITVTRSDNFVIADPCNDTLHILSTEGNILTYHVTQGMGLQIPWALTVSETGYLFIGCGADDDGADKAKIYQLTNFE